MSLKNLLICITDTDNKNEMLKFKNQENMKLTKDHSFNYLIVSDLNILISPYMD